MNPKAGCPLVSCIAPVDVDGLRDSLLELSQVIAMVKSTSIQKSIRYLDITLNSNYKFNLLTDTIIWESSSCGYIGLRNLLTRLDEMMYYIFFKYNIESDHFTSI